MKVNHLHRIYFAPWLYCDGYNSPMNQLAIFSNVSDYRNIPSASLPPPLIPTPVLLECWFLFGLDQCSQFGDVIREKSGTEAIRKGFLLAREEMWDNSSRQRTSPNRKGKWRANLKKNEIRILSLSIFHSVSDRLSDYMESDYEFVTRFLSFKLFCFLRNVCALTRKFMLLDNPC